MRKPEHKEIEGCRNCPWALGKESGGTMGWCELHPGVIDIRLALTWKGGLLDTMGGGEQYPAECPLLIRPVTVLLKDTRNNTEKLGRPVKGAHAHGSRNIEREAAHLRECHRQFSARQFSARPLVVNVAALAREHHLKPSHLRAAVNNKRPWHLRELDAVIAHCKAEWGYDATVPVAEQTFSKP